MRKIGVIINATAGSMTGREFASRILEAFAQRGERARVEVANGKEVCAIAQAMRDEHCDLIVAAGGDGTVSAVASQIIACDTTLGVLPLGTLNHFARDLGIPLSLEEAVAVICEGEATAVDVGSVNEKFFINNSSLGLYADQARLRQVWRKRIGRWLALIMASIVILSRFRSARVTVNLNGKVVSRRCPLVLVSNNEYKLEPGNLSERKRMDGGQLGLYLLRDEGRAGLLRIALRSLMFRIEEAQSFESDAAVEITISTRQKRIRVALDGEAFKLDAPLRYRSMPGGLHVMTPKKPPQA
jgi:YegS/Rv2252/BmrU family lipid kinase